jgi:hypothetical protein
MQVMSANSLDDVIETFTELKRLHQLNIELLEQLDVACGWILGNKMPIPNASVFHSLLAKTKALLTEIQADEPKLLQFQKLSRRKVTDLKDRQEGNSTVRRLTMPLANRFESCELVFFLPVTPEWLR